MAQKAYLYVYSYVRTYIQVYLTQEDIYSIFSSGLETRLQEKYHRTDGLLATSSKYDKRRPVMESARGLQPITNGEI